MKYLFATKFFLLFFVLSVFGQNFLPATHPDSNQEVLWTSWNRTNDDGDPATSDDFLPFLIIDQNNQTNAYPTVEESFATINNSNSSYRASSGNLYSFANDPTYTMNVNSDTNVSHVSLQLEVLGNTTTNNVLEGNIELINSTTNNPYIVPIFYNSVYLSNGLIGDVLPSAINYFFKGPVMTSWGPSEGFRIQFIWDLTQYTINDVILNWDQKIHSSLASVKLDIANLSVNTVACELSISNNTCIIDFNTTQGLSYEVMRNAGLSTDGSDNWISHTNFTAATSNHSIVYNLNHDQLFWRVNEIQ